MTHEWVAADNLIRWEHCARCLIICRADGKESACKGPAKMGLR